MKSLVSSRATAMRGKAISSKERKIILNVFQHFKTENSSLNGNAVIMLTFKVPRIVKHGVKSTSIIRPNRKKEFNELDHAFQPGSGQAYRMSQNIYLCLMHCKIETKSPILEIWLVPEREISSLNFALIFWFLL